LEAGETTWVGNYSGWAGKKKETVEKEGKRKRGWPSVKTSERRYDWGGSQRRCWGGILKGGKGDLKNGDRKKKRGR